MNIVFKCGQLFSTSDLLVMCKALWSFHCHLQQVSLAEPLRGAGITSKVSKSSGSAICVRSDRVDDTQYYVRRVVVPVRGNLAGYTQTGGK
jgi:hypothetical protein